MQLVGFRQHAGATPPGAAGATDDRGQLHRVLVKARQFTDLKVSDAELKMVTSVDDPVRQIQAPELVEDAVQVAPIVGRSGRTRRRGARVLPEADELHRADPELFELVADSDPSAIGADEDRASS